MFILGLVLIGLGVLAIVGAVTTHNAGDTAPFLFLDDVSTTVIFLVGLGSGLAIMLGYGILKFGTKRSLAHRREQKRLTELSEQLNQVQADNRHDEDRDRPSI